MRKAVVLHTHVAGLGVIRALGRMGVPVVAAHFESREVGYTSRYVTEHVQVPHPGHDETAFVDRMVQLGSRLEGSLLIPTDDFSLSAVSRHRDVLDAYYFVAVPDWSITQRVLAKRFTYEAAESIGIPCPRSFTVRSLNELDIAESKVEFPYLLKPVEVHHFFDVFGTKMFEIHNSEQGRAYWSAIQKAGIDVMVQELIPGDDTSGINYNSYFIDGAPVAEFTARKVRLDPPRFGSPRALVSEYIPEILEPGRALIKALGFEGFSCAEFKQDARDGVYKLMEVNGRHNLTTALAVRCGINFPWLMYKHLSEGQIVKFEGFRSKVYWIDLWKDLYHSTLSKKDESFKLLDYIRPYLGTKVFGVWSWRDPKPFFKRIGYLFRLYGGKALSRLKFIEKPTQPKPVTGKAY